MMVCHNLLRIVKLPHYPYLESGRRLKRVDYFNPIIVEKDAQGGQKITLKPHIHTQKTVEADIILSPIVNYFYRISNKSNN